MTRLFGTTSTERAQRLGYSVCSEAMPVIVADAQLWTPKHNPAGSGPLLT